MKMKRKEILEKKKVIEGIITAASASDKDHFLAFPSFRQYHRNDMSIYLESGCGDKLSRCLKQYIQNLLKVNMEGPYGSDWLAEEKVKRREMVAREARYIFALEASNANVSPIVGFVQYRFTMEEEIPVLYVYELQLEARVQGKGLGKFLMQLIELIACKNCMGAVVLTVQKANLSAMDFYMNKLSYSISTISPSRVDPLLGLDNNYEILCKAFDREAKAALEESRSIERK